MSERPTTVALLWKSGSLSGAERRMLSIAQSLNAEGQRTIIVLEEHNAKALQRFLGELPPYVMSFHTSLLLRAVGRGEGRLRLLWWYSGLRKVYHFAIKRKLRKLQERENIGIWHISMSPEFSWSVNGPTLFEVTSPDWADKLVYSNPAMVPPNIPLHAVSAGVAKRLHRGRGQLQRIIEAPMLFPNIDPENAPMPKMNEKENLIVFAHRLIKRKNGKLFARVVHRFLSDHPDWRVAIRGKGPDESTIHETLQTEISEGRVLLGHTSELQAELYRARIFVSIISPDNYPSQSVVEAMTAGNALLLSDVGQSSEKFIDGNGVASPIDEDSLLLCLNKMVSDPDKLIQMSRRSTQLAAERFSQKAYLRHLREVYRECGYTLQGLDSGSVSPCHAQAYTDGGSPVQSWSETCPK